MRDLKDGQDELGKFKIFHKKIVLGIGGENLRDTEKKEETDR